MRAAELAGAANVRSGRAWAMWAVAIAAYFLAIFQRSSLAVSGIKATERFGLSPTGLATLIVVQLLVYASLQVPVGAVLDRYGSRRLLATGALLMASGQLLFATVHVAGGALLARLVLGFGDAMTFISVLRVAALWFSPKVNPLLVQLTGVAGQLGGIAAAIPLLHLLRRYGWTPTFVGAAVLSAAMAAIVWLVIGETPVERERASLRAVLRELRGPLRASWSRAGTRLGLWTHFVTAFPAQIFGLLWGFPFLVKGEQLSGTSAAGLLTLLTVLTLIASPVLGHLTARHPARRSWLVLSVVVASVAGWTAVIAWPGRAPVWLLVLLVVAMSTNGPGSFIGFDYARTFNPLGRLSSALGVVNVGGFVADIVGILLIGLVLAARTPGGSSAYTLSAFKWAFAVQYPLWALGVVQVLRHRRDARRAMATEQAARDVAAAIR